MYIFFVYIFYDHTRPVHRVKPFSVHTKKRKAGLSAKFLPFVVRLQAPFSWRIIVA